VRQLPSWQGLTERQAKRAHAASMSCLLIWCWGTERLLPEEGASSKQDHSQILCHKRHPYHSFTANVCNVWQRQLLRRSNSSHLPSEPTSKVVFKSTGKLQTLSTAQTAWHHIVEKRGRRHESTLSSALPCLNCRKCCACCMSLAWASTREQQEGTAAPNWCNPHQAVYEILQRGNRTTGEGQSQTGGQAEASMVNSLPAAKWRLLQV